MTILMITSILLITVLTLLYYIFVHRKYNYWKDQNVPHLKPTPILGNYGDYILLKKFNGEVVRQICQKFPKEPYIGAYFGTEPTFIPKDPELIKNIMTKDLRFFNGREVQNHVLKEHFGHTLFFTGGDKWKVLRHNMTPLFTSAKMKNMFPLVQKCSFQFENMLDREFKKSNILEVRSIMARFTMDAICSCSFGVDTNTMDEEVKDNPFVKIGDEIFRISNFRGFSVVARAVWPALFYGSGLTLFPNLVSDFFYKLVIGVCESRQYKPSPRNDFIDLIMGWKSKEFLTADSFPDVKTGEIHKLQEKVDNKIMVAQSMTFFAAGYETSATTASWILYELAKDQASQKRVLEEVDAYLARHGNKVKADALTETPFIEACANEALRLYPVLSVITREVTQEYTLPSGVHLDKGVRIHVPVHYLHRNPEYFPEPNEFRPERFLAENRDSIKPYTYMPFGEGPRLCIGMRFAKMQMVTGLITLLKKYRVELAEGTPRNLDLEPRAIVTVPTVGINLKLTEREGWQQRVFDRNV